MESPGSKEYRYEFGFLGPRPVLALAEVKRLREREREKVGSTDLGIFVRCSSSRVITRSYLVPLSFLPSFLLLSALRQPVRPTASHSWTCQALASKQLPWSSLVVPSVSIATVATGEYCSNTFAQGEDSN